MKYPPARRTHFDADSTLSDLRSDAAAIRARSKEPLQTQLPEPGFFDRALIAAAFAGRSPAAGSSVYLRNLRNLRLSSKA